MKNPLRILYVSPEVSPFVMTTDLAEVAGSLPKYLKNLGHDIRVMMPNYKYVNERKYVLRDVIRLRDLSIKIGDEVLAANGKSAFIPGSKVQVYFLDNKALFERDGLYLDRSTGLPYTDNAKRFVFFAIACLETLKLLHWQPDIIHCNGWQTGLVPLLLKSMYKKDPFFKNSRTVFSLHNDSNQNTFDSSAIELAGVEASFLETSHCVKNGEISGLCAGVEYADLVAINVGATGDEISANDHSAQVNALLNEGRSKVRGVNLGIDDQVWNPEKDELLAARYSKDDLSGKPENKRRFLEVLGLQFDVTAPVACMFVNIENDDATILDNAIKALTQAGTQVAVLVFGDSAEMGRFAAIEKAGRGKVVVRSGRDPKLQHLAEAGSDFVISASRTGFFPQSVRHGLAYGTIPIVAKAAAHIGLVQQFEATTGAGNGFVFDDVGSDTYASAVRNAMSSFKDDATWRTIVQNAMRNCEPWSTVAPRYVKLYQKLISGKSSKN